jgi:hypothetical protein
MPLHQISSASFDPHPSGARIPRRCLAANLPHDGRKMNLPKPGANIQLDGIAHAEFPRRLQVRPPSLIVFTRAIPACDPSKRPHTVSAAHYHPLLKFRRSLHKT